MCTVGAHKGASQFAEKERRALLQSIFATFVDVFNRATKSWIFAALASCYELVKVRFTYEHLQPIFVDLS